MLTEAEKGALLVAAKAWTAAGDKPDLEEFMWAAGRDFAKLAPTDVIEAEPVLDLLESLYRYYPLASDTAVADAMRQAGALLRENGRLS